MSLLQLEPWGFGYGGAGGAGSPRWGWRTVLAHVEPWKIGAVARVLVGNVWEVKGLNFSGSKCDVAARGVWFLMLQCWAGNTSLL